MIALVVTLRGPSTESDPEPRFKERRQKRPAGLPPAATTASPYDVRRCVQGSWNRGGGPVCLVGQASEAIFRRRERG
jgi:hypothetical protein